MLEVLLGVILKWELTQEKKMQKEILFEKLIKKPWIINCTFSHFDLPDTRTGIPTTSWNYLGRKKSSPLPGNSYCSLHISLCLRPLISPASHRWIAVGSLRLGLPGSDHLWRQSPGSKKRWTVLSREDKLHQPRTPMAVLISPPNSDNTESVTGDP